VSYAYNLTGVLDVRPLPAAIGTVLGDPVTPRTDRYLNRHVTQDHRGTEPRHSSTGGLKSFVTAARFCLVFDEIRTHLRP
jgi:putative transposase